ncbi:MAG: cob(I)yrinic acid a,c-diamide adenosyltransferase [Pirellulales bacterium]
MKIYTKTGDQGETGLLGGVRVPKNSPRIEACGAVDELNAILGVARGEGLPEEIERLLASVQNALFDLGAELSALEPATQGIPRIGPEHIAALEAAIDLYDARLEPLRQFILPGGTRAAAFLHFARTVCRRAERRVVSLVRASKARVSPDLVAYLNRLGDLLFVLARSVNAEAGRPDVPWRKGS